ncbi:recombinase family protein [Microbacterium saperdae]
MRAASYLRQSIDHAEGIDRQRERANKLIEARGWTAVAEFVDNDVSASKRRGDGTGWARMLASDVDVVVAVDLDRLLRDVRDLSTLIDTGKKVVTVDGEIDLSTADGEFRATMLAGIARFEVRRKGERQRRANEKRATEGWPVPGKRRFGFEPGNIAERPDEAERVRWAFERLATGGTVYGIAAELGREPVRVREILTNPAYAGWVVRRGERFEAHPDVARVVDRELFEDVQRILTDSGRRTSPGPKRRHLASGIARCGVCMRGLISMTEYQCPDPARHVWIKRSELNRALSQGVRAELSRLAEEPPPAVESAEARTLRAERAELLQQRARAQRLAQFEDVDLDALQHDLRAYRNRLTGIEARLAEIALEARSDALLEIAQEYGLLRGHYDARGAAWDQWTDIDVALTEADWSEAFTAIPIEDQRALVEDLLEVVVHSARHSDKPRIQITPKRMENAK